ncbi:polymorphic toxin-type HINT domain-containing protein [Streptomyces sp. NPDC058200]|uniref:polymorphic toxin-type HINT domain-containing protein n=1 Tax=Streptomyces sp. NPDC058200 TaxID=3346378 RepID=UPI0036DFCBF1
MTATAEHPFWVPKENAWVNAADLKPGTTLSTPNGTTAKIAGNRAYKDHVRTYNFSVAKLHTYYVLAGTTPILVHNTCSARVVDVHGNDTANPDALASGLREHTNTALSEWNAGAIGYSAKGLVGIARRPSRANTIKGNILDGRVKALADGDPTLRELFSTPSGMSSPDWINTGSSVPGVGWCYLTTQRMWGQHVFDYGPKYGPGVGILWQ